MIDKRECRVFTFLSYFLGKMMGVDNILPTNAVLIDVRSQTEYKSGFIDGAISIPLDQLSQAVQSTITEKSTPIVVYCASGARSASAKNNLIKLGYDNVSNGGAVASLALKLQKQIYRG